MKHRMIYLLAAVVLCAFVAPPKKKIRVWLAGDSTMSVKEVRAYPETGWGMPFAYFFDSTVTVENRARNGRSTRTFISEKRWQAIMDSLQEGDYVLLQFGHNDEVKEKLASYTTPQEYRANLLKFVMEARSKKAHPVLLTPVSRRRFDSTGRALETHEAYSAIVRTLAGELNVPLIDHDQKSRELLQQFGAQQSRLLFLQLQPGQHPNYPNGKEDNTHFNELGARLMAELVLKEMHALKLELAERVVVNTQKITVAQDGSGHYTTVQAALNAVPSNNKQPFTIYIKNGVYKEKLHLDSSKDFVTLVGEDKFKTILTYNDHTGKISPTGDTITTRTSWSFIVKGHDFVARNLSFENNAGFSAGQAVAVEVQGDRAAFFDCRFLGNQDVLFTNSDRSRQYYERCYIEGTTDFIFGSSTAWFEQCHVHSKKNSHITAASTPQSHAFGYVFNNCVFTADTAIDKVTLGRPWRPYSSVTYINCHLGAHIVPEGWDNWRNAANEKTARYAEYKSRGPGANANGRAGWSRQLTDAEAKKFTVENVLGTWVARIQPK